MFYDVSRVVHQALSPYDPLNTDYTPVKRTALYTSEFHRPRIRGLTLWGTAHTTGEEVVQLQITDCKMMLWDERDNSGGKGTRDVFTGPQVPTLSEQRTLLNPRIHRKTEAEPKQPK